MTRLKHHQVQTFIKIAAALCFFLLSCTKKEEKIYDEAAALIQKGHYRIALAELEKIIIRSPQEAVGIKAAREAARISFYEIKDFRKTVEFLKNLVLYSVDHSERVSAQKQIADIYFTQLNDYPKAVIEINKYLSMISDSEQKAKYKISLARAYYYQNNFTQAENEANEFLRQTDDEKQIFDLLILKGNIALAEKNLSKAIDIYSKVLKDFPQMAQKENVALTLAICFEEIKDFSKAIETLEILKKTHPMPEYVDVRIKRLRERQKNAPGARGKYKK